MVIGRSAPRYEKLALLYPRSKDLQSLLVEYFTVVVRLCHRILKFTQKSALGKFGATLNDSDLVGFQHQLESRARDIKDEVNYLMAHRIEEQASFTTQLWSRKYSKEITHQRQLKIYLAVLEFCSTYDYLSPWKQARRLGNTTLFHQCFEYLAWRERAYSCSLILTGRLGAGKSVLMANMVDDLNLYHRDKNIPVAFFICRHDLPESLKPRTIIGSIVRQLLWSTPALAERVGAYNLKGQPDDFETLRNLLEAVLTTGFKAYLVIDGLDECAVEDRQFVIQELRWIQQRFSFFICASVRKEPQDPYQISLAWERFESTEIAALPDNASDIEIFIETELEARIKSGKLTIGHPLLALEIQDALLRGSQGMFLWVALQIDHLCTMGTDEAIRQALADLPQTLSETFDRILRRIDSHLARSYQKSILELIIAARHPLTPDELREALSVIPGDTTWDASRLVNDIFGILTCCGSLLSIDEEDKSIRLVHSCVRQFLIDPESAYGSRFSVQDAHLKMASTIATYLNYGVFETQISTRVVHNTQVDTAPAKILGSNVEVPTLVRDIAVSLLKLRRAPGFNMGKALEQYRARPEYSSTVKFPFLSYAKSNCLFHVTCALESAETAHVDELFLRLLSSSTLDLGTEDGERLLLVAAEKGAESVVKLLLHSDQLHPNPTDSSGQTPLFLAASSGHEKIVKHLIGINAVNANKKNNKQQAPIHVALENGHNRVCEVLIESGGVNINEKDHSDRTPLHLALRNINTDPIARRIINHPSILLDEQDSRKQTPLHRALERENSVTITKILLSTGKVNTNTKDGYGRSPLHKAAEFDHTGEIAKILLNCESTDPDPEDRKLVTPLHQAIKSRNVQVTKAILDSGKITPPFRVSGARLNANRWTIMHAVAQHGDREMTELLLSYDDIDPNARDTDGKTPLHYGSSADNVIFVRCMLESDKVLANAKDNTGRTPLHVAIMHNSRAVVDLLLSSEKMKPYAGEKDDQGLTPFDYVDLIQPRSGLGPVSPKGPDVSPISARSELDGFWK